MKIRPGAFSVAALLGLLSSGIAAAQTNVMYVCSGERMYVENCNMRDPTDTANCLVGHPDRPTHNGLMAYTNEAR